MSPVTIEDAQARLPELIEQLAPGEELIITREDRPIAKLVEQADRVVRQDSPGAVPSSTWP